MRNVTRTGFLAMLLSPALLAAQGPPPSPQPTPQPAPQPQRQALPPLPPNGWRVDRGHSGVTFRVRHLAITWVNGEFRDWTADLIYDPQRPESSSVSARIQVASINTNHERRDADLRSGRFFAADSFPEMTFVSRRVESAGPGRLRVTGDLTMHGVTRPVTLDTEVSAIQSGQRGRRISFSATTTIDRKEWGMTFSPVQEGLRTAGDEVRITIDIEAGQPLTP